MRVSVIVYFKKFKQYYGQSIRIKTNN